MSSGTYCVPSSTDGEGPTHTQFNSSSRVGLSTTTWSPVVDQVGPLEGPESRVDPSRDPDLPVVSVLTPHTTPQYNRYIIIITNNNDRGRGGSSRCQTV